MSWGRLDDRLWCHPKMEALDALGPQIAAQATGLWVRALSYAGFRESPELTLTQVRRLVPWRVKRAVEALVLVGLWIEVEPGARWLIHGWSDYRRKGSSNGGAGAPGAGESNENRERIALESNENRERIATPRPSESFTFVDPPVPVPIPDPTQKVVVGLRAGMDGGAGATPATTPNRTEPGASLAGGPSGPTETELAAVAAALARAWSDAWLAHTAGPAAPAQLAQVRTLAPWLVEYARRRTEPATELASPLVEAFFDARVKHARPRVEWLLEDPGAFLEKRLAAVVTDDRSYATYLDEYIRNPTRAGDPH